MQTEIAKALAADLWDEFYRAWTFQAWDGHSYPVLEVSVTPGELNDWNLSMRLVISSLVNSADWPGFLFKPQTLHQYGDVLPENRVLKDYIVKQFSNSLLRDNRDKIQKALCDGVPLVSKVSTLETPLLSKTKPVLAALPLSWEKHCLLAYSTFKVVCNFHGSVVEILSEGQQSRYDFPRSSNIHGIKVEFTKWGKDEIGNHLTDLGELTELFAHPLTPFAIYLKEFKSVLIDCDQTAPLLAH
jgi:hypothetical protein